MFQAFFPLGFVVSGSTPHGLRRVSSAVSDGDADGSDPGDICDSCAAGEACLGTAGAPICAEPCNSISDCGSDAGCCLNIAPPDLGITESYCLPQAMCEGSEIPDKYCFSHDDCSYPDIYECDFTTNTCVPISETDGDKPGDGDDPDGDVPDGDQEQEGGVQDCMQDPQLAYNAICDFGAVPFGDTKKCEIEFNNLGPTKQACILYQIDSGTTEEFYIEDEYQIDEGESYCIPVGDSYTLPVTYTPAGPGADVGSLELIVSGESLCRFYIDLVSQEKGEVHAYALPEPPDALDFGDVRVGETKPLHVAVGNRRVSAEDNRTLQVLNLRLEAAEDLNFAINYDSLNDDRRMLLAPGQEAEIEVAFHPIDEDEHENALILETNDPHHEQFRIPLNGNGVMPRVCVTPFPVIFGDVALGESAHQILEVCNCGGYELRVEGGNWPQITGDITSSFGLDLMQNDFPLVLQPSEQVDDGSDCVQIKASFYPNAIGQYQAYVEIKSDAPGNNLFEVPLAGNGVGPKLCTYPTSPIDFGRVQFAEGSTPVVPPQIVELWNCGPGTAMICGLDITMGMQPGDTPVPFPDGTFSMTAFDPYEPTEGNCYPLTGEQRLRFEVHYAPPSHGRHNAIINIDAESAAGYQLDSFVEVVGVGTNCPENYWDLGTGSCSYYCELQQGVYDEPDMDFVDANCDGIDGTIADGVFVSLDGSPNGTGRIDDPVDSVYLGKSNALFNGKTHVYVSLGTYNERVQLDSGIGIYGGYASYMTDPATSPLGWKRGLNYEVILNGDRIGMLASQIGERTVVQLVTVMSHSGDDEDVNSYGIYSRTADFLVLDHVTVEAGDGRDGVSGFTYGQDGADGPDGRPGKAGREDDSSWYCAQNGRPGVGLGGENDYCYADGGDGGLSCKTGGSSCAGYAGQQGSAGAYCRARVTAAAWAARAATAIRAMTVRTARAAPTKGYLINGNWFPNPGQAGTYGGPGGGGGGGRRAAAPTAPG